MLLLMNKDVRVKYRRIVVLVFILIITLNIVNTPILLAQPNWAKKGVYVEYRVRVSVSKTDLSSSLGKLDEVLDGYVEAVIRYTIIDLDQEIFILQEKITKLTKETGGPGNLLYIDIVSQGEANTIKTSSGYQLVYHWYFKYKGIVFPKIRVKPYPSNLYVYMDVSQNPSVISKTNTISGIMQDMEITIRETIKAEYDKTTGFLNKLDYLQVFLVNNLNAITVSVTVEKIGSNIPVVFGRAFDIDTLIALIAGSVLAGIIAMVVFYQRIKKELGY